MPEQEQLSSVQELRQVVTAEDRLRTTFRRLGINDPANFVFENRPRPETLDGTASFLLRTSKNNAGSDEMRVSFRDTPVHPEVSIGRGARPLFELLMESQFEVAIAVPSPENSELVWQKIDTKAHNTDFVFRAYPLTEAASGVLRKPTIEESDTSWETATFVRIGSGENALHYLLTIDGKVATHQMDPRNPDYSYRGKVQLTEFKKVDQSPLTELRRTILERVSRTDSERAAGIAAPLVASLTGRISKDTLGGKTEMFPMVASDTYLTEPQQAVAVSELIRALDLPVERSLGDVMGYIGQTTKSDKPEGYPDPNKKVVYIDGSETVVVLPIVPDAAIRLSFGGGALENNLSKGHISVNLLVDTN